jgi:hypothetical protein
MWLLKGLLFPLLGLASKVHESRRKGFAEVVSPWVRFGNPFLASDANSLERCRSQRHSVVLASL